MATKKMPEWFQANYPEYKKILWGMLRAFIAAFIPTVGLMLTAVSIENFESKETLIKLATSIGLASLAAGLVGLGKYLRNIFPDSGLMQKIPF